MLILADGLCKRYPTEAGWVEALGGVSFSVEEGEFLAIMGPSGSGKTTLMNLLGLLDRSTAGHLALAGEDVTALSPDTQARIRNRQVGFVFQAYNLLPRSTALENVELPLLYRDLRGVARRRRAMAALDSVGLAERRDHWPAQLSGGEQQRVAIARAIVSEPAVILADEPTGALDSRTEKSVMRLFQDLHAAGRTIIVITHDTAVARYARRVLTLRDGTIDHDTTWSDGENAKIGAHNPPHEPIAEAVVV